MTSLSAEELLEMLAAAARCLEAQAGSIDALNVFPVPDGDTGTNMLLTTRAALRAARAALGGTAMAARTAGLPEVAAAAARGALLGARGNSGVILSQILVGIAQALEGVNRLGPAELGRAFRRGSALAYQAVSVPTEGTMLTVMREAAEAGGRLQADSDLSGYLEATLAAAGRALERTPELLPVLREAGVVDAGGQGLYTLLEGMCLYARGQTEGGPGGDLHLIASRVPVPPAGAQAGAAVSAPGAWEQAGPSYGYCVEFVLDCGAKGADEVARDLGALGDSLIVAGLRTGQEHCEGADAPLRVHIHCPEPEPLIRRAGSLGTIGQVQIRDMNRQNEFFRRGGRGAGAAAGSEVVAVVPGAGLARVFLSLGAAVVTVGAGSPSAEELLDAVQSAPGEAVIVLPNNKNVVPVAEQARKLSGKGVWVIPTASVAQGIAALVAFNPARGAEANRREMLQTMAAVRSLEVCKAVRDAHLNAVRVRKDQHAAYLDGELAGAGASAWEAIRRALERLPMHEAEVLTVYYGVEVDASKAEGLADCLRVEYPHVAVEVLSGGQPLYDYLIGVE